VRARLVSAAEATAEPARAREARTPTKAAAARQFPIV